MPGHEPGSISLSGTPSGGLAGRAAELAEIQCMLGRARLVTITGLPGVGKTAAGIVAAAAMRANFADGVWLVTLDSLRDEVLLPHTVADALNVPDRLDRSRLEALAGELSDRKLLLVLDTCEHLAGACAGLALNLLACPGVRILAISREALGVPGGLTVTIRPLPLRHAVAVFGRRGAEAAPGFGVTPENRRTVEAICRRLDRLPLAIELAARQLACGSVEQLRSRLREDYWFLRNCDDAPARHESLRTAIGWSHELCTPAERLLWARLSVFGGSFQLQDAQDVCADRYLPDQDVAAAVAMLHARSVLADVHTDGPARFRLPGTIRAYGGGMLRRLGDDDEWKRRYRAWQAGHRGRHGDARQE
jgi:predicted ATPase